ncbi:MFS transporter [Paenibacillus andongensis]|uniref:MFS transporter n=1 Tax=Paenibacillus andongensis TaxID=2975482 RepID=UPI0021BBAB94|nr:MFS transporter [Paenibacillus andongensis]
MVLKTVLLIVLGFQIMLNITRPLITLYASSLGAGTFDIGMLTAAYAFLPLIFAIHVGKIADRIGDRLPVLLGTVGTAVGMALPFALPTLGSLYASQIIVGVSHVFLIVSLQNILGHAATKENRDHYFSVFSMFVAGGGFIGPVIGGYLAEQYSYSLAFLAASVIGIMPFLFSFYMPAVRRKERTDVAPGMSGSLSLLKVSMLRKALASSALVLYSRDIFVAYFPLLAERAGISTSQIGWIIAIQGLAMILVRLFLSKLTVIMGRTWVLLASILTAGLSFLLLPAIEHVYGFYLLSALMGIGLGCGQPLSMTTTYNASPKDRTGEVLGLRLASNRLSQLIAPMIFGVVGSWGGLVSVFVMSGAILISGALLTRDKPSNV